MLVGIVAACAALLIVAGVLKLLSPHAAAAALAATNLPGAATLARPLILRLFGLTEVGAGSAEIVVGGRLTAAASGYLFLLLVVVASALLARAPGQDCGCFGRSTEPVSGWHIGVAATAFGVEGAAWLRPPPSLLTTVLAQPVSSLPLLVAAALLAWLAHLTMTELPRLGQLRVDVAAR